MLLVLVKVLAAVSSALSAEHSTANFTAAAPTDQQAQAIAVTAEWCREELAVKWLGQKMPDWVRRCTISSKIGNYGAGGSTTFAFDNGEVFGWRMHVEGTMERILDSVVPHEVTHTVFATALRRPLPRWADEGGATQSEHMAERQRHYSEVSGLVRTGTLMPFSEMLPMREYPRDGRQIAILYSQGTVLCDYLIRLGGDNGHKAYLSLLESAHRSGWETALQQTYGLSFPQVKDGFARWVHNGYPTVQPVTVLRIGYECTPYGCRPIPQGYIIQSPIDPKIQIRPPVVPLYPRTPPPYVPDRPPPTVTQPTIDYDRIADLLLQRILANPEPFKGEKGDRGDDGPPGTVVVVIKRDGKELYRTVPLHDGRTVTIPLKSIEVD